MKLIGDLIITTNVFGCLKNVFRHLKLAWLVASFPLLSCKQTFRASYGN